VHRYIGADAETAGAACQEA